LSENKELSDDVLAYTDKVSESVSVTYIPHLEKADLYPELCGKMEKTKLHGHFAENMEGLEILNRKKKNVLSF